jgi:hypothetical protein
MSEESAVAHKALVFVVFIQIFIITMAYFLGSNGNINNPSLTSFQITENNLAAAMNSTTNSFNNLGTATDVFSAAWYAITGFVNLIIGGLSVIGIGMIAFMKLIFSVIPSMINISFGGDIGTLFNIIYLAVMAYIGLYAFGWIRKDILPALKKWI